MEETKEIGTADRIPRITKGWVAANLGVAYDPHMADLAAMDPCKNVPSRSQHFKVQRASIPETWGSQKVSEATGGPMDSSPPARSSLLLKNAR